MHLSATQYARMHILLLTTQRQIHSKRVRCKCNIGYIILYHVTHYNGLLCFTLVVLVGVFLFPEVNKLLITDFFVICTLL